MSKLRCRCRRGMKELDLILEHYLKHCYLQAPSEEQAAFSRLVAAQDGELFEWLILGIPCPDPELGGIVSALRAMCQS